MITSSANERLKAARATAAGRDRQRFLVEGLRLLEDAAAAGRGGRLEWLLHHPDAAADPRGAALIAHAEAAGVPTDACEPSLLAEVSDVDAPQGFLGLSQRFDDGLDAVLDAILAVQGRGLAVVAAGLRDPSNLGAVMRSSAAAGAAGVVVLAGSTSPFHPRAVRASAGALFRIRLACGVEPGDLILAAADRGIELWATASTGEDPRGVDLPDRGLLLLGGEASGLDATLAQASAHTLALPLASGVESLNVAAAAAALLYSLL